MCRPAQTKGIVISCSHSNSAFFEDLSFVRLETNLTKSIQGVNNGQARLSFNSVQETRPAIPLICVNIVYCIALVLNVGFLILLFVYENIHCVFIWIEISTARS